MDEMLISGLIVGSTVTRLEKEKRITFTCYMSYDDELFKLAKQLIYEFANLDKYAQYKYFSDFVQARLIELESGFYQESINLKIEKLRSVLRTDFLE